MAASDAHPPEQGAMSKEGEMPVLSERDWAFWEEHGYVVIPNAVPQANLDALVERIWTFLEIEEGDQESWYMYKPYTREDHCSPISQAGMVEMYQHQTLWDNRQYPRVHQAFSEILGTAKLWVSLDRANMKPPARADKPEWGHKGMIHWDIDTAEVPLLEGDDIAATWRPDPSTTAPLSVRPEATASAAHLPKAGTWGASNHLGVQGVLYLTDTGDDQGGFQCIPGFHRTYYEWVKSQPPDRNPRFPDMTDLEIKVVDGKAGDLVIWHRLLAHGNGHNRSTRPRLAQYITMSPAQEQDEAQRAARILSWQECRPMPRWQGDPRDWEHRHQTPARLTPLGRKLLGVDSWG